MFSLFHRCALAAVVGAALISRASAAVPIESAFLPENGSYSDPANWSPAEVPNNTAERQYNVTADFLQVDVDATISNLALQGNDDAGMLMFDHSLIVNGTTTAASLHLGIYAFDAPALLDAGALPLLSQGIVTGDVSVTSYGGAPATFRFRGARLVALRDADVSLNGPASSIVDEHDNDALQYLAEIDGTSELFLSGVSLTIEAPLLVAGRLYLQGHATAPTIVSALEPLANFDPATRTLRGGIFDVGDMYTAADAAPIELRFANADILNNGSSISLRNETSRIADLNGSDALRNLARNLPGSSLALTRRSLVTPGDFTNDGVLELTSASFTITGRLTNVDATSHTLADGTYHLQKEPGSNEPHLQFTGADVVQNRADLLMSGGATITDELGNNGLRNFQRNLSAGTFKIGTDQKFIANQTFTNAGKVEVSPTYTYTSAENPTRAAGEFAVAAGGDYIQTNGTTIMKGSLAAHDIKIMGGQLEGVGTFTGNLFIGNAEVRLGGAVVGDLTLSRNSIVRGTVVDPYALAAGTHVTDLVIVVGPGNPPLPRWKTSGKVALDGLLAITVNASEGLSGDVTILESEQPVAGEFRNAPEGVRVVTADGAASFIARYDSNTVRLTDWQDQPRSAQFLNLSTRAQVGATADGPASDHFVGGFIVDEGSPKTVLLRGIGPSLAARGIASALPDPKIELYNQAGEIIATNDSWQSTQADEILSSGLTPDDPREAAIRVTLNAGAYTVVLREANGSAGTALVEVYDLEQYSFSKLRNISTRAYIPTGDVLIGGIIAGTGWGDGPSEVVVRAIGPELRQKGVPTAMADPMVELRDAQGELVAANDNWGEHAEQLKLVGLAPEFAAESAMRASLAPGAYTAIVRSKTGAAGSALVEFYDLRR